MTAGDGVIDSLLDRVLAGIEPADAGTAARARAAMDGRDPSGDGLVDLAARLAAAQHAIEPRLAHKHVVVCAADHGVDSSDGRAPAERAGASTAALVELAGGRAALSTIARNVGASVHLIDCGLAAPGELPPGVMDLSVGPGTGDICRGPAMDRERAEHAVHTGIALLLSLADVGADCIALGHIAAGSQPVSATLSAALAGIPPAVLEPALRPLVERALAANPDATDPLSYLEKFGGYDIGVLCGIILGAASLRIPVILDDTGTSAAALLAAGFSRHVTGYLIASHGGHGLAHRQALFALGLPVLFDIGMSQGEGAGAAMAISVLDSAARILCDRAS